MRYRICNSSYADRRCKLRVTAAVLLLVAWWAVPLPAADNAGAQAVVIREALAVPVVQRQGFAGVHTDPVEAMIVAGTWKAPKAGDTIEDAGRTETWAPLTADDEGWLADERMRRGGMYVYATVESDREDVRLLDADAFAMVYVNGELRVGDIYNKGRTILPVLLHKGSNELLFVAVNRTGRMRATLTPAKAIAQLDQHDMTLPDLVVGEKVDCWAALPVLNARDVWAGDLVLIATAGESHSETKLPTIVPQGLRKVGFRLTGPATTSTDAVDVKLRLIQRRADQPDNVLDEAVIKLEVKDPSDLQKRTFVSNIDGSVQYFALRRASTPAEPRDVQPGLILTFHGAAVEAIGHAAAYGEAFDWAHLVAPTNRRPFGFDWESFGELDAMEVLDIATRMLKPDPRHIYLSGHSMGGHGTWHVGVTHPDRFAAIGPSAAWISLFSMDEVRRALSQPGAPGFTDMHELLARPRLVSDTIALSRNFKQQGIYILHGEKDDNVPVDESRRMNQFLTGFHKDFAYHEQPGAGHWWGKPCVNWPPMMEFFRGHALPPLREVKEVDFATANPAVESTCHWVTIEQQVRQSEISSVTISCNVQSKTFTGTTDNVARLTLRLDHLLAEGEAAPKAISLTLDKQALTDLPWPADHRLHLRAGADHKWAIVLPVDASEKSPRRYGPFLHAFNHRFLFVVGTHGSPEENAWTIAKARFDAERFWYQGNGSVDIVRDSDFDPAAEPDRSVILFGNASTNSAWAALMKECPIQIASSKVTMRLSGDRENQTFEGGNFACLLTWPRPGSRVALVGVVGGSGIVGMKLTDRLTSFSSRAGYPDFLIVGDDMLTRGTAAVRAAGYYDNAWKIGAGDHIIAP